MRKKIYSYCIIILFYPLTFAKMTMSITDNYRIFETDSMPNYDIDHFPNKCCPNTASKQSINVKVPLHPIYRNTTIALVIPKKYGIMIDGVIIEPNAAEFWSETESSPCNENDGHTQNQWPYAALSDLIDLGFEVYSIGKPGLSHLN